ncbi:hypothetical protein [Nannocystis sp.]|uniref:hypothetical protein n=1 Tax=Nannocystis sp. TaxID=1962667 RepID=UPI0025E17730|nr:hypothetical protein [Nannocystis sp.]MBK7823696.1 hypothetical protein [Nannocystis sp.]
MSSSDGGESSSVGDESTGGDACLIADVEDTLDFVYRSQIDLGDINTIQASYYNIEAKGIVFFSLLRAGSALSRSTARRSAA